MKIISTPHLSFHILTYICSHMPWSMYALEPILLLLLLDSAPKRTSFSTPSRSLCPSRVPFYALWLWCLDSVLSLPNSGILWLLCSTWKTHIFFFKSNSHYLFHEDIYKCEGQGSFCSLFSIYSTSYLPLLRQDVHWNYFCKLDYHSIFHSIHSILQWAPPKHFRSALFHRLSCCACIGQDILEN